MFESNLGFVAELRCLQHLHEPPTDRNPDHLVGRMFPWRRRVQHRFAASGRMAQLRTNPFYHYLLARTRHYDALYLDAIDCGARWIVNVGCGSDTRAWRFAEQLVKSGVTVVEFDLPLAIEAKRRNAAALGKTAPVHLEPLDLHAPAWPALDGWLARLGEKPALVMAEGLSPYVDSARFATFLERLAMTLTPGCRVVYDFKMEGTAPAFDAACASPRPFRLPADEAAVREFHGRVGLELRRFELSSALQRRLGSDQGVRVAPAFTQDVLLTLAVR